MQYLLNGSPQKCAVKLDGFGTSFNAVIDALGRVGSHTHITVENVGPLSKVTSSFDGGPVRVKDRYFYELCNEAALVIGAVALSDLIANMIVEEANYEAENIETNPPIPFPRNDQMLSREVATFHRVLTLADDDEEAFELVTVVGGLRRVGYVLAKVAGPDTVCGMERKAVVALLWGGKSAWEELLGDGLKQQQIRRDRLKRVGLSVRQLSAFFDVERAASTCAQKTTSSGADPVFSTQDRFDRAPRDKQREIVRDCDNSGLWSHVGGSHPPELRRYPRGQGSEFRALAIAENKSNVKRVLVDCYPAKNAYMYARDKGVRIMQGPMSMSEFYEHLMSGSRDVRELRLHPLTANQLAVEAEKKEAAVVAAAAAAAAAAETRKRASIADLIAQDINQRQQDLDKLCDKYELYHKDLGDVAKMSDAQFKC